MCGIVGYVGPKQAAPFLLEGMRKLEYRGYDSAGIAVYNGKEITVDKCVGRLSSLEKKLEGHLPQGHIGIGHTRWATHGRPSDTNSHPHTDCHGDFVVVHNGIIENYLHIKERLLAKGHVFLSETDTEVVAHLVEEYYQGDFVAAVTKVLAEIQGSYSLVFMSRFDPDKIVCTKQDNPLVIGLGEGENFIASDIPAIINRTRRTFILSDGEMAVVTKDSVWVTNRMGVPVSKKVFEVHWDAEAAEKGGHDHFMIKEIIEQPKAFRDTMTARVAKDNNRITFDELKWTREDVAAVKKIVITACGTAYHAGLVAKYYIEQLARIPVEVDIASEFRYRNPLVDSSTLVIVISQSGETSDSLAAMKEAKRLGARTLAVTNVVGSSISREADQVIYTWAGPEIAVASTKAYTTQLLVMLMLALYLAELRESLRADRLQSIVHELRELPQKAEKFLSNGQAVKTFAEQYGFNDDVFFIGRSIDYAVAMEGALKLKEIAYTFTEGFAAGELKHGPIALVDEGEPVVFIVPPARGRNVLHAKVISGIEEVKARGAYIIAVAEENDPDVERYADVVFWRPACPTLMSPLVDVVPLQLFAMDMAKLKNYDVDKPRNLAKSVTVE